MPPILSASILNADFTRLWECVSEALSSGADMVHFDIADGCFVPNLTFGPMIVKALRKVTNAPFDAHLMVVNPEQYIEELAELKVEYIYFHYEATRSHYRLAKKIRDYGVKAGIALNPSTPVNSLTDILPDIDAVLIMLVEPGFGGQKMIPRMLGKIKALARLREEEGMNYVIVADGGIKVHNVAEVVRSGADIIVVGSGIFAQEDIGAAVTALKKKISEAVLNSTRK